ncbi:MAG: dihydropteroate synthase [Chloroflexi bacterium]|nr:dihydropteroate synthase [Chloroflexota bacterium]
MGICNLSPESFSGDGLGSDIEAVVAQAKRFIAEGADIIDIGGESSRPGTEPAVDDVEKELGLVIPAIERLAGELTVPISIDTYKSAVAREAVRAGASLINDIWALRQDPGLARVTAEAGVPVVLMSNQRGAAVTGDIMAVIIADLERAIGQAVRAGIARENIIIDPGVGFGKSLEQNLQIIRRLAELKTLGQPILLGTSRKSMIGLVLGLPIDQRVEGTAATVAIGIANGADMVRVHDVKAMARVCRMSDAIIRR